jgi:hypothetical protein
MNKPLAFTFIIVTLTIDAMGIGPHYSCDARFAARH